MLHIMYVLVYECVVCGYVYMMCVCCVMCVCCDVYRCMVCDVCRCVLCVYVGVCDVWGLYVL